MSFYSRKLTKLIRSVPGEKTFGVYRFLPAFFLLGATLEFSMINWTVGETNFCTFLPFKNRCSEVQSKFVVFRSYVQKAAG